MPPMTDDGSDGGTHPGDALGRKTRPCVRPEPICDSKMPQSDKGSRDQAPNSLHLEGFSKDETVLQGSTLTRLPSTGQTLTLRHELLSRPLPCK